MTNDYGAKDLSGTILCKSCGLCCTGHLFAWTKLRSAELDAIQDLGVKVIRAPEQRGFDQPCPLWDGVCTVYDSLNYPNFCRTYKCKLLKELLNESTILSSALQVVQQTKELIADLESLLPVSSNPNFRERLTAYLESENAETGIREKANELLNVYGKKFGVKDLIDRSG